VQTSRTKQRKHSISMVVPIAIGQFLGFHDRI